MKCQQDGCGAENPSAARFCGRCGTALPPDLRVRRAGGAHAGALTLAPPAAKSPGLAAVLCIVPGLGQVYNEDFRKGAVMFVASVLLLATGIGYLLVLGWSAYDAYQVARGAGKRWS